MTRAARDPAAVIEQHCQANGQLLLPWVNLIQSASQVVETLIQEIGVGPLEKILVLRARTGGRTAPAGEGAWGGAASRFAAGSHSPDGPQGETETSASAA